MIIITDGLRSYPETSLIRALKRPQCSRHGHKTYTTRMRSRTRSRKAATAALSAADVRRQGSGRHSILDPIITMNAGGLIQSASDSVEQVFGWTPAELFGRNVKILIPEPRRSALDRYLDRYRHADRTKTLQRTRRFDAMRKDGTSLQIELSMSRADLPVHDAPYFIGIIRDVSHQIEVGADSAGRAIEAPPSDYGANSGAGQREPAPPTR